jgi:hypothetical protein
MSIGRLRPFVEIVPRKFRYFPTKLLTDNIGLRVTPFQVVAQKAKSPKYVCYASAHMPLSHASLWGPSTADERRAGSREMLGQVWQVVA